MKTWTAVLDIRLTLTEDEIKKYPKPFADPANPTEAEIRKHFRNRIMNYAESNDGSELLANAKFSVVSGNNSNSL